MHSKLPWPGGLRCIFSGCLATRIGDLLNRWNAVIERGENYWKDSSLKVGLYNLSFSCTKTIVRTFWLTLVAFANNSWKIFSVKRLILIKIHRRQKSIQNYPACNELIWWIDDFFVLHNIYSVKSRLKMKIFVHWSIVQAWVELHHQWGLN